MLLVIYDVVGVRGLDINGEFVKFTGIGVYLEDKAVASLAAKWKGKSPVELLESLDFYRDIIKGNIIYIMYTFYLFDCHTEPYYGG